VRIISARRATRHERRLMKKGRRASRRVQREPSKRSLREMPEVDFRTARVKGNPMRGGSPPRASSCRSDAAGRGGFSSRAEQHRARSVFRRDLDAPRAARQGQGDHAACRAAGRDPGVGARRGLSIRVASRAARGCAGPRGPARRSGPGGAAGPKAASPAATAAPGSARCPGRAPRCCGCTGLTVAPPTARRSRDQGDGR